MFTTEVGSKTSPKLAIFLVIAGLFVGAGAFAISHNIVVHPWLIIGGR